MKKKILIVVSLLVSMYAFSKGRTVVVRTDQVLPIGATVVQMDPVAEPDSIIVNPGFGISGIEVILKDELDGERLHYWFPTDTSVPLKVNIPDEFGSTIIEVRDDNGVVYTDIEE